MLKLRKIAAGRENIKILHACVSRNTKYDTLHTTWAGMLTEPESSWRRLHRNCFALTMLWKLQGCNFPADEIDSRVDLSHTWQGAQNAYRDKPTAILAQLFRARVTCFTLPASQHTTARFSFRFARELLPCSHRSSRYENWKKRVEWTFRTAILQTNWKVSSNRRLT